MTATLVVTPEIDPPVSEPGAPPAPSRHWLVWPPLLAYAGHQALMWLSAVVAGESYFTFGSRSRSDAGLYAAIADNGYDLYKCHEDPRLALIFDPNAWCGDTGWFPLYPWLMRLTGAATGLGEYESGVVVTELAQPVVIVLFWLLLRRFGLGDRRGLPLLALAVLLPAGVYLHAIFPMALAAALGLGYVHLLLSRRWRWAGLAGLAVAMCYPIAFLIASVGAAFVVTLWRRGELAGRSATVATFAVAGGPVVGLLAVSGVQRIAVGHWDAYFKIQEHYGHGVHDPITTVLTLMRRQAITIPKVRRDLLGFLDRVSDLELCWSIGLIAFLVAAIIVAVRGGRLHPIDLGLAIYAAGIVLAPLVAGPNVSQYRSHVLLLPAVLVLRHLPSRLQMVFGVVSLALAAPMAYLFFVRLLF